MYNTIIFDLDGTLLNTIEDLMDSTNYVLTKFNYPTRTLEEITSFVGNGVAVLIHKALPDNDKSKEEEVLACFKEYYEEHSMIKTGPYPGIIDLLTELKQRNIKMAIVSNKFQEGVNTVCAPLFGEYISIMIGETPDVNKKPAPDMVYKAMDLLQADPKTTVYIGDSDVDVATARNSSLDVIGVSWGFRGRKFLEDLNVEQIVDDPKEILNYIKK